MARSRDSDGMLNLFPTKVESACCHDWRDEGGECRMVPAAFADSRKRRLAQAHFELVTKHKSYDQFFTIAFRAFTTCHRGRKNVGGMRRVLLPVDIVVIHAADLQRIGERRRN